MANEKTRRRLMQLRDIFAMRAHAGWLHCLLHRLHLLPAFMEAKFSRYTDARSAAFDAQYGTETFERCWVSVKPGVVSDALGFGYGPVNQDFFREILNAVPVELSGYTLIDIGAGKGAALMLADEFGFRRCVALDLNAELIKIGQSNVARYCAKAKRRFAPEWVLADFFSWDLPNEDSLLFLNNPFPDAMSLDAIKRIEESVRKMPRRVLLVYRKVPRNVGDHLHSSPLWTPLRLAPYWRIYASPVLASELAG